MSGVIPRNLKKNDVSISTVFLASTSAEFTQTDRQTHPHDDSIRRNAIRCISPKNNKQEQI